MTLFEFYRAIRRRIWSNNSILLLVRSAGKPLHKEERPFLGEFCQITEQNIGDCATFESPSQYIPIYQKRLKRGDYGQYGYLNGTCVYREWIQQSGVILFDGCTVLELRDHECCSEYVFCAPSARGNGFQAASGAHLISLFPEWTFYTMVLPEKPISLMNYMRNGYEIHSLLTVKNRFFRRKLTEEVLSSEEAAAYMPKRS